MPVFGILFICLVLFRQDIYIKFGSNPDTGLFSYLKLIIFTPDYAGSIALHTYKYLPT